MCRHLNMAHVGTGLTDWLAHTSWVPLLGGSTRALSLCWGYRIEWDELLAMDAGELEAFQREQNTRYPT
jgi:hypothetical protein